MPPAKMGTCRGDATGGLAGVCLPYSFRLWSSHDKAGYLGIDMASDHNTHQRPVAQQYEASHDASELAQGWSLALSTLAGSSATSWTP